ncbi:hypothetical protein FRC00_007406, partial [Tulasnella sp. 408]
MLWFTLIRAASLFLFAQVAVSVTTFTNPIKNPNGSDPFMVYDGDHSSDHCYWVEDRYTQGRVDRLHVYSMLQRLGARDPQGPLPIQRPPMLSADETFIIRLAAPGICTTRQDNQLTLVFNALTFFKVGLSLTGCARRSDRALQVEAHPGTPTHTKLKATNAPDAWSIDGTVLTVSGANYFVFSSFNDAGLQSLYIAPMTNAYTLGA